MVVMDTQSSTETDVLIDLESGTSSVINGQEASRDVCSTVGQAKKVLNRVWSGFVSIDGSIKGDESVHSVNSNVEGPQANGGTVVDKGFGGEKKVGPLEKKTGAEKPKKKNRKKPPKPPRPPKSPTLDAADRKLIREISELAVLKRARIERMKALKKMKNGKSFSSSNLGALIITTLFCLVIIWQGLFSRGRSALSFHVSPESSVGRTTLISVQFYNNGSSAIGLHDSSSASPNNVEPVSEVDNQGKTSRGAG